MAMSYKQLASRVVRPIWVGGELYNRKRIGLAMFRQMVHLVAYRATASRAGDMARRSNVLDFGVIADDKLQKQLQKVAQDKEVLSYGYIPSLPVLEEFAPAVLRNRKSPCRTVLCDVADVRNTEEQVCVISQTAQSDSDPWIPTLTREVATLPPFMYTLKLFAAPIWMLHEFNSGIMIPGINPLPINGVSNGHASAVTRIG